MGSSAFWEVKVMTEASDLQYAIVCYVQDKVRQVSMDAILDLNF